MTLMEAPPKATAVRACARPARRTAQRKTKELILSSIFAAVACVAGSMTGSRPGLAVASLGTAAAAWVTFRLGRILLTQSVLFSILVFVYGSQSVALALIAVFGETTIIPSLDLADYSAVLTIAQLALLAGTLIGAIVLSAVFGGSRRSGIDLALRLPASARGYLLVALFLAVSQPIASMLLTGSARWAFLIFAANLDGVCFFAGWFASDMGKVSPWCLVTLIGNCFLGALLGSRYQFVLLGLYLVGRLASPYEKYRRTIIIGCLVAAVPLLMMFKGVGDVRLTHGRGSLSLLEPAQMGAFFEDLIASLASSDARGTSNTAPALSRLYAWPNAAAVVMTPEVIPYRGLDAWLAECRPYFRVWGGAEDARERAFEEGTGTMHATDYGFTNNINSTVEFGVLADGWSTAGPFGVVAFAALVVFAICVSEHIGCTGRFSYPAKLIFLCVLTKMCIVAYVYPTPVVIRGVVLNTCFWFVVLGVADLWRGRRRLPESVQGSPHVESARWAGIYSKRTPRRGDASCL